jgi:hypothetical protein
VTGIHLRVFYWSLLVLLASTSFSCRNGSRKPFQRTLRDYARDARQRGAREALVPYWSDEEEGEMLLVPTFEEALSEYQWVVGEPIEEKTVTFDQITNSSEPDSIYTVYRIRVEKRFGASKPLEPAHPLVKRILKQIPPLANEILVLKSGGAITVDGVLLKKSGSMCFSELMPRRYLLALRTDTSGRVGWLEMGCRSIFMLDGDRLSPRQTTPEVVTIGMKERFGNSLASFSNGFKSSP